METLQTLERGMHALECIAQKHGQMTVAQLAEHLGINRTIAYRITRTLSQLGYVRTNENQQLELSSKIINLYKCYEMTIPSNAQQVLNELSLKTQFNTSLVIAEGSDCVVIKTSAKNSSHLQINYQLGSRIPLGIAASGIAIASTYPPQADDSDEIKQARSLGYAYSEGKLQAGAIGLFMPIPHRHMAIGIVHIGEMNKEEVITYLKTAVQALN